MKHRTFTSLEIVELLIKEMGYDTDAGLNFDVDWHIEKAAKDNTIEIKLKN